MPGGRRCAEGHEMTLQIDMDVRWRCNKRSVLTLVRFAYAWAWEYTSVAWCERELGMNHNTVVSMNGIMRETCAAWLLSKPKNRIGGDR